MLSTRPQQVTIRFGLTLASLFWLSATLVLLSATLGCVSEIAPDDESVLVSERAPLDRAAIQAGPSASCVERCGKKAPAGCFCDAQCAQYGDCCADKAEVCDAAPPPSCAGLCGGQNNAGCFCDSQCAFYGDCCGDYPETCTAPVDPCADVVCEALAPTCVDDQTLRTYGDAGCSAGTCSATESDTDCPFGCTAGACASDPCTDVVCTTPEPVCDDATTLRTFGAGGCALGVCLFDSTTETCAAGCDAGACLLPPAPVCTFDVSFEERFSQAFSGADIAFVLQNGHVHRGIDKLDLNASKNAMVARVVGETSPIVKIRLLSAGGSVVLKELSDSRYIYGLEHALWSNANGYNGPDNTLAEVLKRQLAWTEYSNAQLVAILALLLDGSRDWNVPEADRDAYAAAAQQFLNAVESGTKSFQNGHGHATSFTSTSYTSGGKTFAFQFSNSWGLLPSLGTKRNGTGAWGPHWYQVPLAPTCAGKATLEWKGERLTRVAAPLDYAAAEASCASLGGHLASLHSALSNHVARALSAEGDSFIGLHDRALEGSFTWVNGDLAGYLRFHAGQPDNWNGDEDCVHQRDFALKAEWNDLSCTEARAFVCGF